MTSPFFIDRPDGTRQKIYGYRFAAPPSDAKRYSASDSKVEELPPKVDLRRSMTVVENQGGLNSCVANAVAGAYEYLFKKHKGIDTYDVSRLFVYYNARQVDGMEGEDEGALIGSAINGLKEHGACSEQTWPYREEVVNEQPDGDAYQEASGFKIEDVQQVPTELEAWKHCLAEGYPVIFGCLLYKSFDSQRKKGLVPMPSESESARESHGGHAMLCVGYSDRDKLFIVRNSWGTDWGDGGYCYIPYDYLMNEKYNGGDSWIIRQVESIEVDEENWSDDDESILEELESELADMSDEDYSAMIEAMGDVPLESRLALVFLTAAEADGDISAQELEQIGSYFAKTFKQIGSPYDPVKVLEQAKQSLGDDELLQQSVDLLGTHLSKTALAGIVSVLEEVIGVDGLSDDEEGFLYDLVSAWQVAGGEGEYEDEDESDEDGDYEDEDGDYEDEDGDYEDEDGDYEDEDGDYEDEDGEEDEDY